MNTAVKKRDVKTEGFSGVGFFPAKTRYLLWKSLNANPVWQGGSMGSTSKEYYSPEVKAQIEEMADTIEILQDDSLMKRLKRSDRDIAQGRIISSSDIKAKYGL